MTTRRARAFAMVEVVMATAIVGGMAAAALTLVGSVSKQKADAAILARGQALARALAEEIATKPVNDWTSNPGGISINIDPDTVTILGPGKGAVVVTGKPGNRSGFTKVDHYRNYTENPPKGEDGTAIAGYTGWSRSVKITPAELTNPRNISAVETGLRCIAITASYNGKPIATTTFLRSSEWERVMP